MATHLLDDLEILYSAAPETAVNTPYSASADFKSALVNSMMPPTPQTTKIRNDMVGGSNEWGRKGRSDRWPPQSFSLSMQLNTEFAAVLLARCFGGTITNTLVATGVYDHTVALQTKQQTRVPKLTTIIFLLGGNDFIHASCAVDSVEIAFDGGSPPVLTAAIINTGYSFDRLRDLDPAIVIPSLETYHVLSPSGVVATFNDGSLKDFGLEARLLSGRCGMNNAIEVPARLQDPLHTTGDYRKGVYSREIKRGKRSYTPTLRALMGDDLEEFVTSRDNTDITSLGYKFIGDPIGATAYNHEVQVTYPLSTLTVESDTENRDAAMALSFDTDREDAVGGIANLRVRNGVATLA